MAHGKVNQHERRIIELVQQERKLQVREVRQNIVRVDLADGQGTGKRREGNGGQQPVLPPARSTAAGVTTARTMAEEDESRNSDVLTESNGSSSCACKPSAMDAGIYAHVFGSARALPWAPTSCCGHASSRTG